MRLPMNTSLATLKPSGIRRINALAAQHPGCIALALGEPDFPTPDVISAEVTAALDRGDTHYPPNNGRPALREALSAYMGDAGLAFSADEVILTDGATEALSATFMAMLNPGDEVIIPTPAFGLYESIVVANHAKAVFLDTEPAQFQIDEEALRACVTPATKAIVICTPNNPTGAVYSEESLRKLAALAVEHDFFVVADEIYEKLVYDGAEHFSVASISQEVRDRTVTVNGFSKAYAMTGWRIGYAAARANVIKGIMAVQSQTTSATSAISQKAAVEALRGPQHDLEVMVEEFRRRKDYVVDRLNRIPGITCPDVKGAFYVYPDVQLYLGKSFGGRKIETAVELCQYLLDEALISTVPGEAYNVPGKIRISYSNSMENLEKALDRMEQALAALH